MQNIVASQSCGTQWLYHLRYIAPLIKLQLPPCWDSCSGQRLQYIVRNCIFLIIAVETVVLLTQHLVFRYIAKHQFVIQAYRYSKSICTSWPYWSLKLTFSPWQMNIQVQQNILDDSGLRYSFIQQSHIILVTSYSMNIDLVYIKEKVTLQVQNFG